MQYAVLGKTGLRVSRLGFGAMRLPMKAGRVDRDLAVPMMHRAFVLGVNLIDTAVMYCNHDSQRAVGEALQSWPGRIYVSTKNHLYDPNDERAWWKNLEDSLRHLGVDSIDLYHHHGLTWKRYLESVQPPGGILRWMLRAKEQGMIRHICFSFHDTAENLKRLAETGHFEAVILQYNLLDRSNEPAFEALRKAGLGVIAMGPVGGGRLGAPTLALARLLPGAASVAEIALRFVLASPYIHVALSGMSAIEHVEENARIASRRHALTASEKRRVRQILSRYKKLADLYCTGCKYCMPCPAGVNIPAAFMARIQQRVYGLEQHARFYYKRLASSAVQCVACGQCLAKCPQHIDIIAQLRDTIRALDERYGTIQGLVRPARLVEVGRTGRRTSARLQVRLELHNISDKIAKPRLVWSPSRGVCPEGQPASIRPIGAFERRHVAQILRVSDLSRPIMPGVKLEAGAELQTTVWPESFRVALARPEGSETARTGRGDIRLDKPEQLVQGKPEVLKAHRLRAGFRYTDSELILRASVADDLLAPRSPRHTPAAIDRVVLILDARRGLRFGTAGYGDRVLQMSLLAPPVKGPAGQGVAIHRPAGLDASQVRVATRRTRTGFALTAHLPWALLGLRSTAPGLRLGLEIALISHNRARKPVVRLSWTGDAESLRHAGLRGYLFFVDG